LQNEVEYKSKEKDILCKLVDYMCSAGAGAEVPTAKQLQVILLGDT
jgi:hypothetical protein